MRESTHSRHTQFSVDNRHRHELFSTTQKSSVGFTIHTLHRTKPCYLLPVFSCSCLYSLFFLCLNSSFSKLFFPSHASHLATHPRTTKSFLMTLLLLDDSLLDYTFMNISHPYTSWLQTQTHERSYFLAFTFFLRLALLCEVDLGTFWCFKHCKSKDFRADHESKSWVVIASSLGFGLSCYFRKKVRLYDELHQPLALFNEP